MEYLRQARIEKGVSQQAVADYLGITRQAYSNYENGNREPDYETLLKLAEYFETSVDVLLRGKEKAPTPEGERKSGDPIFTYAMSGEVDKLTPERKEMLRGMAQYLIDQQAKEEQEKGRK